MVYSVLLMMSLAFSALGQQFTSAPVTTDNVNATYRATLFDSTSSSIRGTVTASSGPGGVGLSFQVSFTGLPPDVGPFPYHIHILDVPSNGDCYATSSHLDPYNRGEQPPCDPSDPATCQVGDLSGKHGFATDPTFTATYTDDYVSNNPQSNAFMGDKSIVIHAANGTRLNCGNFQLVSENQIETSSPRYVALTRATGTAGATTGTGSHVASTSTHATTTSISTRVVPTSTSGRAVPASAPNTFTSTHATTSTTTHVVSASVPTRFTSTTRPHM